jgi:hypothetical protein
MAERWLLVETFGGPGHEEPTVIGLGCTPKHMVPLASVLGRGRYLDDVRALVARVVAGAVPVRTTTRDGLRDMIGDPLIAFSGRVHGAYVWMGPKGSQPPPRDPAGAWYFNLTTGKIGGSDDLLDLYGVPEEARRSERVIAEAFTRLVANADEAAGMALIVKAKPGAEHQATWSVRRDDGQVRAANFACRAVLEHDGDGEGEVVLRGITHDIGAADTTPSAPPPILLAQQVLTAAREPGEYRAIVNLRTLTLLRWIDDPMPDIAWENNGEYPPAIHPADIRAATALSDGLANGRVNGTIRLRSTTGQWMPVDVDARLMALDQHTTAALVTLSTSENSSIELG